jgi:hypothetical protein
VIPRPQRLGLQVARGLVVVCLLVMGAPFLLGAGSDLRYDLGIGSFFAWMVLVPLVCLWLFPLVFGQARTLHLSGTVLTGWTFRGERSVDLAQLRSVRARALPTRGSRDIAFLRLHDRTGGTLVLTQIGAIRSWGADPAVEEALRLAASQPGVHVTVRARLRLLVPVGEQLGLRFVLWLRSSVLFLLLLAVLTAAGAVLAVHASADTAHEDRTRAPGQLASGS